MSEKPDISALFSMLSSNNDLKDKSPEELLAKLITSSSNNDVNSKNTENPTNNEAFQDNIPDMEMIMKLMKLMKASNEKNPSKDLLNSLKPFLNDSRKEKVDQYVKILGISKALEIFNDLGDNSK